MPLELTQPTNIATPVTATAFEMSSLFLTIDPASLSLASVQVGYIAGNPIGTPPVFTPIGSQRTTTLNEQQCAALLAANPTLLSTLKPLIYSLIEAQEGLSGTVV